MLQNFRQYTFRNAEDGTGSGFASGPTSASGRIKVADKDIDAETGTFSIAFADGSSAEVTLAQFSGEIRDRLALHGLSQKLGDSYASVKGDVAEAKKRFEAVLNQLLSGEWKQAREAGEGGAKVTELAAAIAQFKGVEIERATAVVAKAEADKIKAWKAHPRIKAIIAEIRARKAAERAAAAEAKAPAEADLEGLDLGA